MFLHDNLYASFNMPVVFSLIVPLRLAKPILSHNDYLQETFGDLGNHFELELQSIFDDYF